MLLRAGEDRTALTFSDNEGNIKMFITVDDESASISLGSNGGESFFVDVSSDLGPAILLYDSQGEVIWSTLR